MAEREHVSDAELDELEGLAPPGSAIALQLEPGRDGRAWVGPDEAARKAHRAVPRLVSTIRALRREADALRAENEKLSRPDRTVPVRRETAPDPSPERAADELGSLLSAPFAVSPRAASAARTEPLAALAVQVARALGPEAKEIERARLIAMALAASQGDLEKFWAARKQRAVKKSAAAREK